MAFLDNAGGYTPVPDELVKRYDFTTAYVWGVIWRYTQMEDGICHASHDTIAERAGMSRRTVIGCIHKLVSDGYIEDLTPGKTNKPHSYNTKVGEDKISTVQILHSKPSQGAEIAQQNEPTVQDLHSHCAEFAQPTVQNLHSKKDIKDTSLRDNKREKESHAPETQLQKLKRIGEVDYLAKYEPLAVKLSEICGNPHPRYVSNGKRRELAESVAQLVEWGVTTEQIQDFKDSYWWADTPPRYRQAVDEWGRYLSSKTQPVKARKSERNGQGTAGHRQTYKTKQNGRPLDPRAMDTTAIEREIADLERKLGARQNRPDLSPG